MKFDSEGDHCASPPVETEGVGGLRGSRCYRRDGRIFIEVPEVAVLDLAQIPRRSRLAFGQSVEVLDSESFLNAVVNQLREIGSTIPPDCIESKISVAIRASITALVEDVSPTHCRERHSRY